MYDLTKFTLRDMTECGIALRNLSVDAGSMEEVADKIVHYLSPLRKGHSRWVTVRRCSSSQWRNRSCAEVGSCKIKRAKLRVSKISK